MRKTKTAVLLLVLAVVMGNAIPALGHDGGGGDHKAHVIKVEGGGFINSTDMTNKSTFGFRAQNMTMNMTMNMTKTHCMGNLQYNDHGAHIKLHGNVSMLSVNKTAGTAMFTGMATVTNATGVKMMLPYTVNVMKGTKGVGIFNITVMTTPVYTDEGTLLGGDIRVDP